MTPAVLIQVTTSKGQTFLEGFGRDQNSTARERPPSLMSVGPTEWKVGLHLKLHPVLRRASSKVTKNQEPT